MARLRSNKVSSQLSNPPHYDTTGVVTPGRYRFLAMDDTGERYVHAWPDRLLARVPEGAKVLDVGCSRGAFGEALKAYSPGRAVYGIEPTGAAEHAATVLDGVVRGSFPADLPAEWTGFDVVTFFDVLEHLVDPWEALRRARDLLAPGGRVMATIPNIRCVAVSVPLLLRGEWRYTDVGLLDRTHLRFFTRSGIEELFAEGGYATEAVVPWLREDINTRVARVLKRFGHRFDDLTSLQFLVTARPR